MNLNIKWDELINVGNQVSEKGSDFQELLEKIRSVNTELQSYWEGQDAAKYSTAITSQLENMQKLANTINEIGPFLVKVGNAYNEASEKNANGVNI